MIFEITLSLLTLVIALFIVHIQIKKNRDYILEKINIDRKKIENEVNARLSFLEEKQVQVLKSSIEQIESEQRNQQDILEYIKTQLIYKNNESVNSELQTIQCQVQELTHHLEELKKRLNEASLNQSSHDPRPSGEHDSFIFSGSNLFNETSDVIEPNPVIEANDPESGLINKTTGDIEKQNIIDNEVAATATATAKEINAFSTIENETDFTEVFEQKLTEELKLDWVKKIWVKKNKQALLRPAHRSIDKSESKISRTRSLNPNILAFHQSGQWEFFVEMPDKINDQEKIIKVIQGAITLPCQEASLFGPLLNLNTAIEMYSENSGKRTKCLVGLISTSNPVLTFRLIEDQNDWKGTLISSLSKGFYLTIAPINWKRDEESGGYAPVDPEPLQIKGLTAHYFDIQEDQAIAFIKPDEKKYKKKLRKVDFILTGQSIDDAEEKKGPLFISKPPDISGTYASWKEIRSIVIGEEGQGQGQSQWCEQHDITIFAKHSWPILSLGQKGNSGWFFVRFYDDNGKLVNSLPFRFVRGLKSVQTPVSIFPGYREERPARLEFRINEQIHVNPVANSPKLERDVDTRNHKITFISKPSPTTKKLTFEIQENQGRPVRVSFDVDRLWWRIRNEQMDEDSVEWTASLLKKTKSAFNPTANEVLELHLPLSSIRQPIKVGFQRQKALDLQISIKEQTGKVPLRWFCDVVSEKSVETKELGIWIGNDPESPYYKILECMTHAACPHCAEIFDEKPKILDHLLNDHDAQLFQNLMIKRDRESGFLPRKLYVCLLDGMFFAGDPMRRDCLPGEMENHFRDEHPNDRMSFRVIDDPDAIERIKGYKLEQVWKCRICEDILIPPGDDPSARSRKRLHLLREHQNQIYQLID